MNKVWLSIQCALLLLVAVDQVFGGDDVEQCPFHKQFCDSISTKEGHDKFKNCYDEKAPQYMKDMGETCKNQVGESATPMSQYWDKTCMVEQRDLANKINLCMKVEFKKTIEKDPNCLEKMGGFLACVAP